MGKSTILDYALKSSSGFRYGAAAGVESEVELAFGSLQLLCAPLMGTVWPARPGRNELLSRQPSGSLTGRPRTSFWSVWPS